ncbi:hypothetical protein HMPREF3205_01003 [Streptococcus pasteurianus]|nr:hypothetical protein HMPREF3205_01003 [Streptococcus pasteurianus]
MKIFDLIFDFFRNKWSVFKITNDFFRFLLKKIIFLIDFLKK